MREQTYLPWSFVLDEVKIMVKMSSLMKLRITDCRLCDCEYGLWGQSTIKVQWGRVGELLTQNEPRSGKSVKCRIPFSFDLAVTRCKFFSPGIWQVCNRAMQFWKSALNGVARSVHWERVRQWAQLRTCHPRILHGPGPDIDWNVDCTAPDSGRQPSGTSPALGWSVITVKPMGRGGSVVWRCS
jgi:hypothetical protein